VLLHTLSSTFKLKKQDGGVGALLLHVFKHTEFALTLVPREPKMGSSRCCVREKEDDEVVEEEEEEKKKEEEAADVFLPKSSTLRTDTIK
jgi:hypothetical protein